MAGSDHRVVGLLAHDSSARNSKAQSSLTLVIAVSLVRPGAGVHGEAPTDWKWCEASPARRGRLWLHTTFTPLRQCCAVFSRALSGLARLVTAGDSSRFSAEIVEREKGFEPWCAAFLKSAMSLVFRRYGSRIPGLSGAARVRWSLAESPRVGLILGEILETASPRSGGNGAASRLLGHAIPAEGPSRRRRRRAPRRGQDEVPGR